jgi:hypothetical protein
VPSKLPPSDTTNVALPDARANQLLAALPDDEWQRWLPQLEAVELPLGHVLYEPGVTLSHVYFPTTAIVSLLYVMENGASAESDGRFRGHRRRVHLHGRWLHPQPRGGAERRTRLPPAGRRAEDRIQPCAGVDQQLCRWLLLSLDRLQGNQLLMTQELIANMLGVRREGVTEGALKLQTRGLISYSRGRISVLDRAGLERLTCECYAVVKTEYDRLLPTLTPR